MEECSWLNLLAAVISGGLAGTFVPSAVTWLLGRHKPPIESHDAVFQSFERQIASAEKRGDKEKVDRLREQLEQQEEAWRAQQGLRSKIPVMVDREKPPLAGEEAETLREYLERAMQLLSPTPDDLNSWGYVFYATGDYEKASYCFDRAARLDRTSAVSHVNRASALIHLGRYEEGLAACEEALRIQPSDLAAIYGKACALSRLQRGEAALLWLRQATEANPIFREWARQDEDFTFLRDHPEYGPRFWKLVGREEEKEKREE